MWAWWWIWVAVIFVVMFLPLSYGWGRGGWGPPYPTYYRRRYYRGGDAPIEPEPREVDPRDPTVPPMRDRTPREADRYPGYAWSWLADLFWLALLAALGWAIYLWVT